MIILAVDIKKIVSSSNRSQVARWFESNHLDFAGHSSKSDGGPAIDLNMV